MDTLYQEQPLIQQKLNHEQKQGFPLVGLQFILEVQKERSSKLEACNYICTLCSKKMSAVTLFAHVKSVPHRLKYSECYAKDIFEKYGKIQIKQWTAALVKEFTLTLNATERSPRGSQMAVATEKTMNDSVKLLKKKVEAVIAGDEESQNEEIIKNGSNDDSDMIGASSNDNPELVDITISPGKADSSWSVESPARKRVREFAPSQKSEITKSSETPRTLVKDSPRTDSAKRISPKSSSGTWRSSSPRQKSSPTKLQNSRRQSPSHQSSSRPSGERQSPSRPSGRRQSPSGSSGRRQSPSRSSGGRQSPSRPSGDRKSPSRPSGDRKSHSRPSGDPKSPSRRQSPSRSSRRQSSPRHSRRQSSPRPSRKQSSPRPSGRQSSPGLSRHQSSPRPSGRQSSPGLSRRQSPPRPWRRQSSPRPWQRQSSPRTSVRQSPSRRKSSPRPLRNRSPNQRKRSSPRRNSPFRKQSSPYNRRSATSGTWDKDSRSKIPNEADRKLREFRDAEAKMKSSYHEEVSSYLKKPESHPQYKMEWCKFWERRYKEVENEGSNPGSYDFKSEWMVFWKNRLQDLCNVGLKIRRQELLTKFQLSDPNRVELPKRPERLPSPSRNIIAAAPVSFIPQKNASNVWQQQPTSVQNTATKTYEINFSVVGTLKLLTELEDQLGSLADVVKNLLKNAIDVTVKGRKPISLFEDSDNLGLLRLTKKKLNSQIEFGVLGDMGAAATHRAIEATTWLIREVEKHNALAPPRSNLTASFSSGEINVDLVAAATIGMDSMHIAQYIAQQLFKIGKPDTSDRDLQNILMAVSEKHVTMKANQSVSEKYIKQKAYDNYSQVPTDYSSQTSTQPAPALFPSGTGDQRYNTEEFTSPSTNQSSSYHPTATPEPKGTPSKTGLSLLQSAYKEKDLGTRKLEDLQEMLCNFRNLSSSDQQDLTNYLKRLEATDSRKVTRLRAMMQQSLKSLPTPTPESKIERQEEPPHRTKSDHHYSEQPHQYQTKETFEDREFDKNKKYDDRQKHVINEERPATSSFSDLYSDRPNISNFHENKGTIFSQEMSSFRSEGLGMNQRESFGRNSMATDPYEPSDSFRNTNHPGGGFFGSTTSFRSDDDGGSSRDQSLFERENDRRSRSFERDNDQQTFERDDRSFIERNSSDRDRSPFNRPGRSFDQDRSGRSFDQDRPGRSFDQDQSGRSIDPDRMTAGRSFDQDRMTAGRSFDQGQMATGRSFGQDRIGKSFDQNRPMGKSFDQDRTGRSFDQDRSDRSFDQESLSSSFRAGPDENWNANPSFGHRDFGNEMRGSRVPPMEGSNGRPSLRGPILRTPLSRPPRYQGPRFMR